jgi:hypothetical protein
VLHFLIKCILIHLIFQCLLCIFISDS